MKNGLVTFLLFSVASAAFRVFVWFQYCAGKMSCGRTCVVVVAKRTSTLSEYVPTYATSIAMLRPSSLCTPARHRCRRACSRSRFP